MHVDDSPDDVLYGNQTETPQTRDLHHVTTTAPLRGDNGANIYPSGGQHEAPPELGDKGYEVYRENSKRSTVEEELRSLSTTPRMSHEDYGRIVSSSPTPDQRHVKRDTRTFSKCVAQDQPPRRIVSPPHTPYDQQLGLPDMGDNFRDIMYDADTVRRDLTNQQAQRKRLEARHQEVEDEKKDINMKLAALRVKLGVANANSNVSKTECEKMRKDLQETQIKKARLEERLKSCSKEIERLSDPGNPDSNVNLKKIVVTDRKEIRRLRTELDALKTDRSQVQVEILDRDSKIRQLQAAINEARDRLDTCQSDYDVAKISAVSEKKKREEMEHKHADLVKEKNRFDNSVDELQSQLDTTLADTAEILQRTEKSRDKEETLFGKIAVAEKKLKEALTEIEQQKNRNMPVRTASSIKHHQYRMSRSGVALVSDTTPHVVVAANPKGSIAASGYLGKSVISVRKSAASLPARPERQRGTQRGRGASLPDRK